MTKSDSFQRYNCAKKVAALKLMVNSWSAFWLLCILLLNTAATDVQIGRFGCFWVVLFQFWALVTAHNTHPRNRLNWTRSERKRDRSSFTLNNDQSSCVWIFHWTPHVTHSPSNNRMSERNSRYSPVAFRLRDQRSWKPFFPLFFFLSRLHDLCPLSSKAPKLWPEGWRQNSSGRPIVNLMTTPSVGGVDITSAFFSTFRFFYSCNVDPKQVCQEVFPLRSNPLHTKQTVSDHFSSIWHVPGARTTQP